MHVQRLTEIAEWLERGAPEYRGMTGFDMSVYFRLGSKDYADICNARRVGEYTRADEILRTCGTVCCVAGAAISFYSEHPSDFINADEVEMAGKLLELSAIQAYQLFAPRGIDHKEITPAWAARCIRNLLKTGYVQWEETHFA